MTERQGLTPSQTVGPYWSIGMTWPDGAEVVPEGTPGAFWLGGVVRDGAGEPLADALIETWQADPDGRFDHPDDPRGARPPSLPGFRGFARVGTGADGRWRIRTVKPGPLPAPGGGTEAPHLDLSVFGRGLLDRLVTRVYFADEEAANAADPVLAGVPPDRRHTLLATPAEGGYTFRIVLQGPDETVFFAV